MITHKEPLERPHIGLGLLFHLRGGPLGRRTLVERTGWTESVVRTELEKLEAQGWVEFAKPGTSLTEIGAARLEGVFGRIRRVTLALDLVEVHLDRTNCAALVRGVAQVPKTWQMRDAAVREGASGILVLAREQTALHLVDVEASFSRRNSQDTARIERDLGPLEPGDWIVIAFATSEGLASAALWRAMSEALSVPALDRPPRGAERGSARESA